MKVFIYCGIPGSGKSTRIAKDHPLALVVSADAYFVQCGEYRFNPSQLPAAHAACLRQFVGYVSREGSLTPCTYDVVVDNTNTTIAEIAPYAALALAYGCELEIVTVLCEPEIAAQRNVHGVPLAACVAMEKRLSSRAMPPWWPHRVV